MLLRAFFKRSTPGQLKGAGVGHTPVRSTRGKPAGEWHTDTGEVTSPVFLSTHLCLWRNPILIQGRRQVTVQLIHYRPNRPKPEEHRPRITRLRFFLLG